MQDAPSMQDRMLALAEVDRPGLITPTQTLTYREVIARGAHYGAWMKSLQTPGPFHVGVLLENTPGFCFALCGAALVGATIVGANATHRGDELARDLSHTATQLLITSESLFCLVEGLELTGGVGTVTRDNPRVLLVDADGDASALGAFTSVTAHEIADPTVTAATLGYLLFTSGTSGAPKACRCSQGRLSMISGIVTQMFSLSSDDVVYEAMPLFHSNALMAGWGPAIAAGATVALPGTGRFSASGFLPDIRRTNATFFNYVGKPLSFILATEERPDDADNTLVRCFGNEGSSADVARFAERFGCTVTDSYGSTEGGATVSRTPDSPEGSLGRAAEGTMVINADTGEECARATFDEHGRLANADDAIGELVSQTGGRGFEGYWDNADAEKARVKEGWFYTGDLAYRDEAGFFYFAGRDFDWLRVDGENFAAAPVERIVSRNERVVLASIFAVEDLVVGDQVMAALQLSGDPTSFDGPAFASFLSAQRDLGPKQWPRLIRVTNELPVTATSKVLKRQLRGEAWSVSDPVFMLSNDRSTYVLLDDATRHALDEARTRRFTPGSVA